MMRLGMCRNRARADQTYLSDSPCHLLTRSLELRLKKVPSASVATAFARNDFPVPGGPYKRMPFHGLRFPVNKLGNFVGKITASCNEILAPSSPATSSHLTSGFSEIIAPDSASLCLSGLSSPTVLLSSLQRRGQLKPILYKEYTIPTLTHYVL